MGGNNSTRRVSFEADENDNVTVVKGIRLSENVINRMREPSPVPTRSPIQPPGIPLSTAGKEDAANKKITENLENESFIEDTNLQKRLEQNKAFVRNEISKVLEEERSAASENITRAVLREQLATEEERLKAKKFAKQLEEKDRELKKQDAYYKEQLTRLEERSSQFYKVTTEQYQKAMNEAEAKFKRYESHPICADLQAGILRCYQENHTQTLSCSMLAKQYLQCVNNVKQTMLQKGG
ncbi:coiled-coil-helix-coiled-coil-helix domain containing 3a isoform X2 [Polypterus senegalus]|uniref:coiled-coil-helix-coiled-coil-helix domain containing 3a isoform X2 n=1 Tax=Polypterus senegalus TaxID=55291 RepID=UPI00196539C9|nr:coiled-coil-helix-coiled-coil-helix domain containing 3a isoform X2 [Polypterus senegalus]